MAHEELIRLYINGNVIPDWKRRNMGSVVPEFDAMDPADPAIRVTREVCQKIAEDCIQQFNANDGKSRRTRVGYSILHSFCKDAMVLFDSQDRLLVPLWDRKAPDALVAA